MVKTRHANKIRHASIIHADVLPTALPTISIIQTPTPIVQYNNWPKSSAALVGKDDGAMCGAEVGLTILLRIRSREVATLARLVLQGLQHFQMAKRVSTVVPRAQK